MRERVVYFLGAGFSAPLGLPVMSDFLLRSKDLYFSDLESYEHFLPVFERIDRMAKAKNYYRLDLFNIEEVLSLLEMESYVGTSDHREDYLHYLRDVVRSLTPAFNPRDAHDSWNGLGLSLQQHTSAYASFVGSLFGVQWQRSVVDQTHFVSKRVESDIEYSVVTLNYDMVIESSLKLLEDVLRPPEPFRFATSLEEAEQPHSVPLAKLHGSVEPLSIVPPTWNKVTTKEEVKEAWKMAFSLLARATQIRFVGYSLPPSDTYVRYLLSSSVLESEHLKRVDAICLDPTGEVAQRYGSLVSYYRFRFRNGDARRLLTANQRATGGALEKTQEWQIVRFDKLEGVHEGFMEDR